MMTVANRPISSNSRSTFNAKDLHVIIPYSNHLRHQSRYHLMLETVEHMLSLGVTLYVVELAHGSRQHVLELPVEVHHIKVRTHDIMWHKENQIDIGAREAIRNGAKYLMWCDGDLQFSNRYMATDVIEALQNHAVVQPWQYAVDLDHRRNIIRDERGQFLTEGFCSVWQRQVAEEFAPKKSVMPGDYSGGKKGREFGHFGYAWAATTEAYLGVGGMLDWIITGAADYFMALGFAGLLHEFAANMDETATPGYRRRLFEFHRRCELTVKGRVGCVPGTVLHGWHGPKAKRGYMTRPRILKVSKFDPDLDLVMDNQGLYQFTRENRLLRDGLVNYFLSREEDQLAS